MKIAEKIKLIRAFRNISLAELGSPFKQSEVAAKLMAEAIESGSKELTREEIFLISDKLNISKYALLSKAEDKSIQIIEELMWCEEELRENEDAYNEAIFEILVKKIIYKYVERRQNAYAFILDPPTQISNDSIIFNSCFNDFLVLREHFKEGRISKEVFFEYKITFPQRISLLDFLCKNEPTVFKKTKDGNFKYKISKGRKNEQVVYDHESNYYFKHLKLEVDLVRKTIEPNMSDNEIRKITNGRDYMFIGKR